MKRKVFGVLVELREHWALPPQLGTGGPRTPSNSELRRWLRFGAISVNGVRTNSVDYAVDGDITEFIIFPNGWRRATLR